MFDPQSILRTLRQSPQKGPTYFSPRGDSPSPVLSSNPLLDVLIPEKESEDAQQSGEMSPSLMNSRQLRSAVVKFKKQSYGLLAQKESLRRENDALVRQNQQLTMQLSEGEHQIRTLKEQYKKLESDYQNILKQVLETESHRGTLLEQRNQLLRRVNDERRQSFSQSPVGRSAIIDELENTVIKLTEQNQTLSEELDKRSSYEPSWMNHREAVMASDEERKEIQDDYYDMEEDEYVVEPKLSVRTDGRSQHLMDMEKWMAEKGIVTPGTEVVPSFSLGSGKEKARRKDNSFVINLGDDDDRTGPVKRNAKSRGKGIRLNVRDGSRGGRKPGNVGVIHLPVTPPDQSSSRSLRINLKDDIPLQLSPPNAISTRRRAAKQKKAQWR